MLSIKARNAFMVIGPMAAVVAAHVPDDKRARAIAKLEAAIERLRAA